MDDSATHSSHDGPAASFDGSSTPTCPQTPAETAAAPPSLGEQRRAKNTQIAAEESWQPGDATWADEAVEEDSDALFRSIYERSAVGIALVDLKGRISKCNPTLAGMLGYSVHDLPGRAFTDLSHPEDGTLDQQQFEELIAGRTDHYTIEKRYIRKDGSTVWGQMTASVISREDRIPRFVIGIVEDVTERHNAEEANRQRDLGIREAYSQVIAAVTGGRLVLKGSEEILAELGDEVWNAGAIESAEDLSDARHRLCTVLEERFGDLPDSDRFILAVGEAATNAFKHGRNARMRLLEKGDLIQVEVVDDGNGIDFADLPKATLVPGYSCTTSLGMGFTLMLAECERVLIATGSCGTRIILETQG